MSFVYPNPGIMSAQKSSTTERNCDKEVQNSTDTKLACWAWSAFSLILTAFSSIIKPMDENPFEQQSTQNLR